LSLDFSTIWDNINKVISNIVNFFQSSASSLQGVVSTIANTGQGILQGLIAFGSTFGSFFYESFRVFAEKIVEAATVTTGFLGNIPTAIVSAFNSFAQWLHGGITWLATQIWNSFSYLTSGLMWIAEQITNAFVSIYNWIVSAVENTISWFSQQYDAIRNTINTWFTNTIKRFRLKLRDTIMINMGIVTAWKTIEKVMEKPSIKSILSIPVAILGGFFGGAILGEIVNSLVPVPETTIFEIIPPLNIYQITLPRLEPVQTPKPPEYPIQPKPPTIEYSVERTLTIGIERQWTLSAIPVTTTIRSLYVDLDRDLVLEESALTVSASMDGSSIQI